MQPHRTLRTTPSHNVPNTLGIPHSISIPDAAWYLDVDNVIDKTYQQDSAARAVAAGTHSSHADYFLGTFLQNMVDHKIAVISFDLVRTVAVVVRAMDAKVAAASGAPLRKARKNYNDVPAFDNIESQTATATNVSTESGIDDVEVWLGPVANVLKRKNRVRPKPRLPSRESRASPIPSAMPDIRKGDGKHEGAWEEEEQEQHIFSNTPIHTPFTSPPQLAELPSSSNSRFSGISAFISTGEEQQEADASTSGRLEPRIAAFYDSDFDENDNDHLTAEYAHDD